MQVKPIKLTFDTNCLINYFDCSSATATSVNEISELIHLNVCGKVQIAITTRVELDLSHDKNDRRRTKLMRAICNFPIVGSVIRVDISFLDSPDGLAGGASDAVLSQIEKLFDKGRSQSEKSFTNNPARDSCF